MNLALLLVRSARVHPERPAVLHGAEVLLTYRGLADRVARLAGSLRAQGLAPGERVAVWMTNRPEYLETLYAVWWAGAVAVPINAKLHPKETAYILGHSGAAWVVVDAESAALLDPELAAAGSASRKLVVGSSDYAAAFAAAPAEPLPRAPDDPAWLFYTSGTTGRPKGVVLTHRNLLAMAMCYFADVDDVGDDDAIVYAAPMSHGAGIYNFMFVAKAARHVVPASGGFDPAELMALAQDVGRLSFFAAPTMVMRLVDHVAAHPAPLDGLKTIVYGGGPMYVEDVERALAVLGPRLVQIYGQGESPMTITALAREHLVDRGHPRWRERIASVGVAQTLVEVGVVGAGGKPCPVGEVGEVVVRGETVMSGYWNDAAATAQALAGGWLHTGDLGALDGDGFLTLKDRSKDLIISGGSNIYPREIEEVLLRHPRVREVAVVGERDPEWGEAVVAFVVAEGVTPEELDALCLEHIARFKRPKRYRFLPSLPKNHYGKVLKTALRELASQGEPAR